MQGQIRQHVYANGRRICSIVDTPNGSFVVQPLPNVRRGDCVNLGLNGRYLYAPLLEPTKGSK